jgi:predicted SAM-dependent methyltransferase
MKKFLLAGCGSNKVKQMAIDNNHKWDGKLVTLDINIDHNPDVVWDLNKRPLSFNDNEFDEIHFYEVLEHIGKQGDYINFFKEFEEYWRILKQDGIMCLSVPRYDSLWAWGDPGHTRVINDGTLIFLDQDAYKEQVGKTPITDYRNIYGGNFKLVAKEESNGRVFFAMIAKK